MSIKWLKENKRAHRIWRASFKEAGSRLIDWPCRQPNLSLLHLLLSSSFHGKGKGGYKRLRTGSWRMIWNSEAKANPLPAYSNQQLALHMADDVCWNLSTSHETKQDRASKTARQIKALFSTAWHPGLYSQDPRSEKRESTPTKSPLLHIYAIRCVPRYICAHAACVHIHTPPHTHRARINKCIKKEKINKLKDIILSTSM